MPQTGNKQTEYNNSKEEGSHGDSRKDSLDRQRTASLCAGLEMGPRAFSRRARAFRPRLGAEPIRGRRYPYKARRGQCVHARRPGRKHQVSVGEDGILLIDDQFAPLAEKIRAAVSDLRKGKIEFVLNTHWHPDHTGGNPIFGKEGKIIAHANVRRRLSGEKPTPGRPPSKMEPSGLPAITFHDGITLHFNGEEVRILHFPHGHTDGDSIIFFDTSKVVHMGDHFFNDRFPFVDLTSGGTLGGYMTNVATVIELLPDDWKVIPGHGALGEKKDLQRFRDMLESTVAFVRKQMDAGKTLEEIRDEGLPEKWESWGEGFISEARWIETIHESLSNAPETAPDAEKDKGAEKEKPAASEK